jgi:hypothetical protein
MNNQSVFDENDKAKGCKTDFEKYNSNINPISEKEKQESHIKSYKTSLQNSAFKNFKSELKTEPANLFL